MLTGDEESTGTPLNIARADLFAAGKRADVALDFEGLAQIDGKDVEARTGMCYASIYAALSYGSAGLKAIHGIAYGVAANTHRSHGATRPAFRRRSSVRGCLPRTRSPGGRR